jgi:hypothetical protein
MTLYTLRLCGGSAPQTYSCLLVCCYLNSEYNPNLLQHAGTSFAVNITQAVLREASDRSVPVYNFNIVPDSPAGEECNLFNVIGPAEETLSQLKVRGEGRIRSC